MEGDYQQTSKESKSRKESAEFHPEGMKPYFQISQHLVKSIYSIPSNCAEMTNNYPSFSMDKYYWKISWHYLCGVFKESKCSIN